MGKRVPLFRETQISSTIVESELAPNTDRLSSVLKLQKVRLTYIRPHVWFNFVSKMRANDLWESWKIHEGKKSQQKINDLRKF